METQSPGDGGGQTLIRLRIYFGDRIIAFFKLHVHDIVCERIQHFGGGPQRLFNSWKDVRLDGFHTRRGSIKPIIREYRNSSRLYFRLKDFLRRFAR